MSTNSVLVVGGGFLGRAIAMRLIRAGLRVTVLSPQAETGHWPSGVAVVSGRQEDRHVMERLIAGQDAVIHAAWGTTPGSSAGHPAIEVERGLNPFLAFLETLQRFPEVRLFFLSSGGTVYGEPECLPIAELAPLQPRSCHGAGKAAAELFLTACRSTSASTIILRPSNIYGPGQALRSGFGVVRNMLDCAVEGRLFKLWGEGSPVRDYLYIDDFVDAVSRLIAAPEVSGVFNVGSGAGTSLAELIGIVEAETGRHLCIERHPPRTGEVARVVLDITALSRAVDWKPGVDLETGVRRTIEWMREGCR